MTPSERKRAALRFLMIAKVFHRINEFTIAGEMLWGAINHLGVAIADHQGLTRNGMSLGRRQKPKEAMRQLQSANPATPSLVTQFDNIAELHGNFYNSHLAPQALRTAVQAGIQCIEYLRNRPEVQGIP